MRTWHAELCVVGCALVAVAIAAGNDPLEWIGSAAVLLTFCHAQVADRLAAAQQLHENEEPLGIDERRHTVECWRWQARYFVGKEALWFAYFLLHGSWAALAGVVLFLAYPIWRRWRRHRHSFRRS